MVHDRLAQQFEGKDTCLAVGLLLNGVQNQALVHAGGDVDNVVAWLEE